MKSWPPGDGTATLTFPRLVTLFGYAFLTCCKYERPGQSFDFSEGEIVDWLYMDGAKMKGNYTACALLKREPGQAAAFKARFGLDCDL